MKLKTLTTKELLKTRDAIVELLAERLAELEAQLQEFGETPRTMGSLKSPATKTPNGAAKKRRYAPKYRSKRDRFVTWTGQGQMPRWLRDEMKDKGLKKEDFLI